MVLSFQKEKARSRSDNALKVKAKSGRRAKSDRQRVPTEELLKLNFSRGHLDISNSSGSYAEQEMEIVMWSESFDELVVNGLCFEEGEPVAGLWEDVLVYVVGSGKEERYREVVISYRYWFGAEELFERLELMFWGEKSVRNNVVMMIVCWIIDSRSDFENLGGKQNPLYMFLKKLSELETTQSTLWYKLILESWHVVKVVVDDTLMFNINDIMELSNQLTLLDAHILKSVDCNVLFSGTSTIIADHTNKVSNWVTSVILSHSDSNERAEKIQFFIDLCMILKLKGNFNSLFAIYTSLSSYTIQRLKKSWKKISSDARENYLEVEALGSPRTNYRQMRVETNKRKNRSEILIPLLMVSKIDVNNVTESMEKHSRGTMVNLKRFQALRSIYDEIAYFKSFITDSLLSIPLVDLNGMDIPSEPQLEHLSCSFE